MNIEKILEFVNREVPTHAEEIWSAIDLLATTVEKTKCAVDGSVGKLSSAREYSRASEYIQMSQELAVILDAIREYNKKYALVEDEVNDIPTEDEEDDEFKSVDEKVNYEKYRVNEEVAYNLYTDFTHKKPAAFSLDGIKYPARKWKYVLIQTCEILAKKDATIFNTFVNDHTMHGSKRAYFSLVRDVIRKPQKIIGTKVFVETNLSANNIRNIIVNMLEKYNIPKNQYQIYLSKDLSPLHTPGTVKVLTTENDSRRQKSRCAEYDQKKDVCMCVQSPYFINECGGSSHCKYYSEKELNEESIFTYGDGKQIQRKKVIEIISVDTQKRRRCTHCQGKTEQHMMNVEYLDNGKIVKNKLPIFECSQCGAEFLVETIFKTYTMKKDIANMSLNFIVKN